MPYTGSGGNPTINTAQTPDTYYLSTNPLGNSLIIGEAADAGFDFAHAQAVDPTLFIQSRNQSTTQWTSLSHDGINGVLSVGAGRLSLPNGITGNLAHSGGYYNLVTGPIYFGGFDLVFGREAAAVAQLGDDINGAAINQTLKAHDGITGTDIAGASLTLAPGKGTGAAVSGSVILNRDIVKATGTTAQTYGQAWLSAPTKILSNTSATAQTVATINTTTLSGGGVTFHYSVTANSATAVNTDTGSVNISWNNVSGTVAAMMGTVINAVQSNSSGTLAATPTVTVATNVVSIKLTPTWTTIVPTTVMYSGAFIVHGPDSVVPA